MDKELSELQLDALKEVGNIGSGNAATALSQMLNKKIDMTVPEVDLLPYDEMIKRIGSEEDLVVAVLLGAYGDAPGNLLFIMNYEKAQEFSKVLLNGFEDVSEDLYISVFQEIGNILGNSYINAINRLTGLNLVTSVPAVAVDMLTAVLSSSFMASEQFGENILAIDTNFIDNIDKLESGGNFFYIPRPNSLNIILAKLGL
ncbi:MAG: chemotaxis protein CheC [Clostridiales bacterium]|nr:chemotaxis protein CheC [Clostridiales bacterium]